MAAVNARRSIIKLLVPSLAEHKTRNDIRYNGVKNRQHKCLLEARELVWDTFTTLPPANVNPLVR
jgi:hypothetical protein